MSPSFLLCFSIYFTYLFGSLSDTNLIIQYLLSRGASPQELAGLSDCSCNICAGPSGASPRVRTSRSRGGRKALQGD